MIKRERERERDLEFKSKSKKIIFDFGCNNGQNLKYFLEKADIVVAVEPNSNLCRKIKNKYINHINNKRLFIENVCLGSTNGKVDFYISNDSDMLSSLSKEYLINFKKIKIKAITPKNIVKKYLRKFNLKNVEYIKIDVEGFDDMILKNLFDNKIYPKYLSAECHRTQVLNLVLFSPYKSFKVLPGEDIENLYKNTTITDKNNKKMNFCFPKHSSGPYGHDAFKHNFFLKDDLIIYFMNNGCGWKDLICSLDREEHIQPIEYNPQIHNDSLRYHLKKIIPSFCKMIKTRITKYNFFKK